jgi:long-chain acyl-CoA synthetase
LKRQAIDAFPSGAVWEFYGSTEGQFTACSAGEWLARPGTVGRARPHRRLATDADGTIWCDVPEYARFAYWRDPERTAQAWRGSAFTVGDLGRLDDDGYLFLDGRRDDLVISGGVNVYPAEVEQALAAVPGVEEVAVFGVADERWGQRVCVAVVGDVDPELVRSTAAERLAPFKRPKDVYVVASLPRTSTGKLRRGALARQLGLEDG